MQKYVYLQYGIIRHNMIKDALYQLDNTPFTLDVLASIYPNCKQITDKARRLEQEGRIIRLKRGLYVRSGDDNASPDTRLMANHIYGPSYVSCLSALRQYGLVPERLFETVSMCTKRSRSFDTPFGRFSYYSISNPYFALGIRMQNEGSGQFLVASPEKALCDLMTVTSGLVFQSAKELAAYLEEDLRMDTDALKDFDAGLLEACRDAAMVKPRNIAILIKLLK